MPNENPWPSAPDFSDLSEHNTCQSPAAPASGSALAKVCAETLTRIKEGKSTTEEEVGSWEGRKLAPKSGDSCSGMFGTAGRKAAERRWVSK